MTLPLIFIVGPTGIGKSSFAIDLEIVDEDAEEVEQCIVKGNDYKDCVDRMVETMTEYDKWGNIKR